MNYLQNNTERHKKKNFRNLLFICLAAIALGLSGCGGTENEADTEKDDKLNVVTTLFPYYDFTRQIAGDEINLELMIPAGMDSHSFEPTPTDIRKLEEADILIANGGHMEHWVEQVVDSLNNESLQVIYMMEYVDVVTEEVVEGMEENHSHSHEHTGEEVCTKDHDHSEDEHMHTHEDESQYEIEYDEHIWTSPVNAKKITETIAEKLKEADPIHADFYENGKSEYVKKLEELDQEFREIREEAIHDIIIMGDKFPLRYFADEYHLRYRAAFSGCASDTEPSAKTIAYLIDKVKDENLPVIYYLELSSHRVSEIIGEETGASPLLFHSCHNVTRKEFEDGITYLDLMAQNVINLREGLCK